MSAPLDLPAGRSLDNVQSSAVPSVDDVNGWLAQAQALHARRALERAIDHGAALLAALDLPPVDCRTRRERKARRKALAPVAAIHAAIGALDALDAPEADKEPFLGAPENHPGRFHVDMMGAYHVARGRRLLGSQREWASGFDGEEDGTEQEREAGYDLPEGDDERCGSEHDGQEPDECAEHCTAPERYGCGFVRCGPDDAEDDTPREYDCPPVVVWVFGPGRVEARADV